MEKFDVFLLVCFIMLFLFCIFAWGGAYGTSVLQEQAINNNVAEYQVDPQTGVVEFVWLECGD